MKVEAWLSLVEHRVRDAGVAGSNPVASMKTGNIDIGLMDISIIRFLYVKLWLRRNVNFSRGKD